MPVSVIVTGLIWGIGLGFPLGIFFVVVLWLRLGRQPRTITVYLPHPDYEQYVETQPSLHSCIRHTSSVDVLRERSTGVPRVFVAFRRTVRKTA